MLANVYSSSGVHRKQNFKFLSLKVTQQSQHFLFTFSPPLFFSFLASFFFFCWAFSRLHFGGGKFLEELL